MTGIKSLRVRSVIKGFAVFGVLLAIIANTSGRQRETDSIEATIKRVKEGQVHPSDVYRLAKAGATNAIPALKRQFDLKDEALLRAAIASALVRLGAKERTYWEFLTQHASAAVESDAPSIFLTDSQGRVVRGHGTFSSEFHAWAKSRNLDPAVAAQAQVYEFPNYVTFIGMTGDPRGRALLRRALSSRNYLVQAAAAKGLAKLQDKDSIPLIIRVCEKAPAEMAPLIAGALVFFDDQQAQAAADRFIPNKKTLEHLRKRSRGKGADPFMN